MENDLLNAVIEVITITPSDYGVKIDAQDKKVYNVPKTLKAGGLTRAWEQLVSMELKASDPITGERGSIVAIGYSESPNKHGGTSRYIKTFRETNEEPSSTNSPTQVQSTRTEPPVASQSTSSKQDETFWDKKAYKQCLWNYWLKRYDPFAGSKTVDGMLGQAEMDTVYEVFNQIEKDAEERFSTSSWDKLGAKLKAEAPKEEVAEDIAEMAQEMKDESVSDIPF